MIMIPLASFAWAPPAHPTGHPPGSPPLAWTVPKFPNAGAFPTTWPWMCVGTPPPPSPYDERPRSGRVQAVRRQVASGHNDNKPAGQRWLATQPRRPACQVRRSPTSRRLRSFPQAAQPVRIPSTRRTSPQPAPTTVVTSVLYRPPARGSAPPTVQSAPRVGTVVDQLVHSPRHRCGTDRLERGSQPKPDGPRPARHAGQTDNAGPRSSGDRASVP